MITLRLGIKPVTLAAWLILLCVAQVSTASEGNNWVGRVVGISDGDTITVLKEGRGQKIRLYGIDTPELGQAFGKKAKRFTSDQVFNHQVKVVSLDRDRYGRIIALVYPIGKSESLNEKIIKTGYGWIYVKYCKADFCAGWYDFEKEAKEDKLGLWIDSNSIAPWIFREKNRNQSSRIESITKNRNDLKYYGNTSSHIFHKIGCKYCNCKNCTTEFYNRNDAINAGYKPCKICKP